MDIWLLPPFGFCEYCCVNSSVQISLRDLAFIIIIIAQKLCYYFRYVPRSDTAESYNSIGNLLRNIVLTDFLLFKLRIMRYSCVTSAIILMSVLYFIE